MKMFQSKSHIALKFIKRAVKSGGTGNDNIIMSLLSLGTKNHPCGFPQAASNAIAHHGVSKLASGRKA